jgi:type I restriction enzyme M protein
MLDTNTKSRIDSARDVLVGKVPDPKSQVEQITIALIYKFMDDMDRQAEELGGKASFFEGEFKKYRWADLLDKRLSGHQRLLLYAEGIEKMNENNNIPQLFRDIFKGVFLPYRDPETLNLFLKEIDGFPYDHSEQLGNAYEYLLSVLGTQGDAGQFRTPRHIIDFVATVVDPQKSETVLDPACGTAGFLIAAYKHILKHNKNLTPDERARLMTNFCGYDIAPDMVRLSRVNMYLHGFPNPVIHEYDTLTSEDRWDERYDVIMANPPFMTPKGGIRPHNRFSIKANRSEVLFVDYIAEHLNPGGRAGIIVPEGIVARSQGPYISLRRMLVEDYLWAVVSLPAGVFNPYSLTKTNILFFDRKLARRSTEVLFVNIENDGFDLGAQREPIKDNDIPEALKTLQNWGNNQTKPKEGLSVLVPRKSLLESDDCTLAVDRYRVTVEAESKWPRVALGDFCEIIQGGRQGFSGKHFVESGGYPAYGAGGLNGYLPDFEFKVPAVILSSIGARCGKCFLAEGKWASLANTQIIFPDPEKANVRFLWWQLNDEKRWPRSGTAQPYIKPSNVRSHLVVLPPLKIQERIVSELDELREEIGNHKEAIASLEQKIQKKLATGLSG